jgi:uroporphyrinogen III methyltransferase / synthase
MKSPPTKKKLATVYLVGSGPGDIGLLTLRAKQLLEIADVVFYDHLVNPEILQFCKGAKLHYVGKIGHGDYVPQEKIEEAIVQAAQDARIIVRLKGGDPFIFGRGGEEAEFLSKHDIPFEVVPGVSSATAVPAYAGIPLTHRLWSSSVTFVTGHEDAMKMEREGKALALNWSALAGEKTLVFLMGVKNLSENFKQLLQHGMPPKTPAAIIEWGTYPRQRTVEGTLSSLPALAHEADIQSPSIVVVGEVVKLRKKLRWFETKALFGKKILVTRSRHQAGELSQSLRELGAQAIEFPTIEIFPPEDLSPLDRALKELSNYQWILFTSVNAVNFFFERMEALCLDICALGSAKLAAVGKITAQSLIKRGLHVDRQPEEFTSDALSKVLKSEEIRGRRILFPRAELAREAIVEDLKKRGALLELVTVYRTRKSPYDNSQLQEIFEIIKPDLLTFASSATVGHFVEILKATPYFQNAMKIPAIVMGPVTRESALEAGMKVVGMPDVYTIPDMVQEVLRYFQQ